VDRFVAVSAATAESALLSGECSRGKLRIVINGTDLSRFPAPEGARAAIREELGIPSRARVLVTVGRLVKEKNHALLLRAVSPLLREDRRLVLVGDGPLRDDLRAQIEQLEGRRYVHLTGARRDIPELLASADAFVLSSESEGLPIGLLEALAAGLPAISTAVGGIPATIRSEDTGLLVPPGDEAALTAALRRVFDDDPALAGVAARGRSHVVETYSAEKMASAYASLYEECLGK
jgi:glycosyltransferase involved in cell wall biosynthesis